MVVGILTLAVVTTQMASGFIDQETRRRLADAAPPVTPNRTTDSSLDAPTLADVAQWLARIEELLLSSRWLLPLLPDDQQVNIVARSTRSQAPGTR